MPYDNQYIESFEAHMRDEHGILCFQMPKHKIVCPNCRGEGTTGPGWVFTQEDRYEMGYEFDELMSDMSTGAYDVQCEQCQGLRVIDQVDESQLTPTHKAEWHKYLADIFESYDIQRQERAMGA